MAAITAHERIGALPRAETFVSSTGRTENLWRAVLGMQPKRGLRIKSVKSPVKKAGGRQDECGKEA